jgi:hypothetical protein
MGIEEGTRMTSVLGDWRQGVEQTIFVKEIGMREG